MNFGNPANKYRNKKVELDGILFDSKKESAIYLDLKRAKATGEIKDFERQKEYTLIPAQYEFEPYTDKKGRTVDKAKCVERACTYKADFVVTYPDGEVSVIDCKGARGLDQKYGIKRKLMRHVHGIAIKEV